MSAIVLFDGDCNFCDASVQFIIQRDSKGYFNYASLQSDAGQQLLKKHNVPTDLDSFVMIDNEKVYVKSTGALHVAKHLDGAWKLLYAFIVVPAPIRNAVYDYIAANRYKWFGKKADHCMLPSPEVRRRFL